MASRTAGCCRGSRVSQMSRTVRFTARRPVADSFRADATYREGRHTHAP